MKQYKSKPMTSHQIFEAKCTSDLLEHRGENGEFTTLEKARQFYDRRLLAYYKEQTLKLDLFKINVDYKQLYNFEKRHNERLTKQCLHYQSLIEIQKNKHK